MPFIFHGKQTGWGATTDISYGEKKICPVGQKLVITLSKLCSIFVLIALWVMANVLFPLLSQNVLKSSSFVSKAYDPWFCGVRPKRHQWNNLSLYGHWQIMQNYLGLCETTSSRRHQRLKLRSCSPLAFCPSNARVLFPRLSQELAESLLDKGLLSLNSKIKQHEYCSVHISPQTFFHNKHSTRYAIVQIAELCGSHC